MRLSALREDAVAQGRRLGLGHRAAADRPSHVNCRLAESGFRNVAPIKSDPNGERFELNIAIAIPNDF